MTTFITGGPLNPVKHRNILIDRIEFTEIIDHIKNKDNYIVLESARQTGKTTLLYQIQHRLHNHNYGVAYLDFSRINLQIEPYFYRQVCTNIKNELKALINYSSDTQLELNKIINFKTFSKFLKSLSSQTPQARKLILIFEEIGNIPENIFSDLFSGLRGFFTEGRGLGSDSYLCQKIIIICAGTLDTKKLIEGENSPFKNICEKFTLSDFSLEHIPSLTQNFQDFSSQKRNIIADSIYQWTNGHPYLTQRLCQLIDEGKEFHNAPIAEISKVIDCLVENNLIYDNDVNLEHLFNYLERLEKKDGSYFRAVKRVLYTGQEQPIRTLEHENDLLLIGVIKRLEDRRLVIRNKIYEEKLKNFFETKIMNDNKFSNQRPKNNPWISGSFYIFLFLVVLTAMAVVSKFVSLPTFPMVIISCLLAILILGALQARNDDTLSEKGFLKVINGFYNRLPLLKGDKQRGNK